MPLIHTVNTLLPSPALFWGFFYFPRWKSRPHVPRASYYLIKKGKRKKKVGKKEKIKKKKNLPPPPCLALWFTEKLGGGRGLAGSVCGLLKNE